MSSDISTNKKARRDYEILDTYECGMELKGTEVKSIRAGKVKLALGLGKGKTHRDQRYDLKARVEMREAQREVARINRR